MNVEEFIQLYKHCLDKAIKSEDSNRTKELEKWYNTYGNECITTVVRDLKNNAFRVDSMIPFINLYSYLLIKNANSNNLDSIIDYLYFIPDKMKSEYLRLV